MSKLVIVAWIIWQILSVVKKVTKTNDNETNDKTCNCRPEVETNDSINELSTKVYFSISETEFKSRNNNHTMSFRNRTHKNDTEFSKYVWSIKDQNKDFDVKWSIFKKSSRYSIISKSCNLCLLEKLVIRNFKEKDIPCTKEILYDRRYDKPLSIYSRLVGMTI